VLDERTLGFADFAGNRQYITLSNLESNDRASCFCWIANRQRIKVWGGARVVEGDAALMQRLVEPDYWAQTEGAILFTVEAWDVNCSQHITERYTTAEVAGASRGCASGSQRWKPRMPGCGQRRVIRRRRLSRNKDAGSSGAAPFAQ
jgi:uncharacterized protein